MSSRPLSSRKETTVHRVTCSGEPGFAGFAPQGLFAGRDEVAQRYTACVAGAEIASFMPVDDVFTYSRCSRTLFDYLLEPLRESMFRGLRSS